MTSSNPAAELVRLVTGYRVSQAIHVAATLGIADLIKDRASSASDLAVATNSTPGYTACCRALAAAVYSIRRSSSLLPRRKISARMQSGHSRL